VTKVVKFASSDYPAQHCVSNDRTALEMISRANTALPHAKLKGGSNGGDMCPIQDLAVGCRICRYWHSAWRQI